MVSQGARADPVVSMHESGESIEGSVTPVSEGGVEIGREGVGADAPLPPSGAPVAELPPAFSQIFKWPFRSKHKPRHSYLHRRKHLPQRQHW
ncbi:UNVERIFIED_CONTAM: hypothetical protein Sradi_4916500 [Sesamum radiatum]|uniref:Uncharacterized protein n=1 Tax=Sesamum radiatum TaxID=300843 RepID=A0AAW2ME44_SESRA